jgi:ABC-type branched-subunit amino acid transport system substrate-binding protein
MAVARVAAFASSAAVLMGIAGAASAAHDAASPRVVVPRGQPVQMALAVDLSGFASEFGPSIVNAVRMAVEVQKSVRGFPIRINVVDAPCSETAGAAAATSIVANTQNVAVLGHVCSAGFDAALPVYEAAGVVTISGSATADSLPALGPSVFNRTAVSDGQGFDDWYAAVGELPRNLDWQEAYAEKFDAEAMPLADLYYDAARVLVRSLQKASQIGAGRKLVVNRAALARAVRATTSYQGVTCVVTLDSRTGNRVNDPAALERCGG